MNKKNKAEANTAVDVGHDAGMIAEGFVSATCQHEDWEQASKILHDLADGIVTPECLRTLGDLFHEIASEGERLSTNDEHEAETTEALCKAISTNLGAKYSKFVGRG